MGEQLDPEMLKYLDLLTDYDAVQSESEWDLLENLQQHQNSQEESDNGGDQ